MTKLQNLFRPKAGKTKEIDRISLNDFIYNHLSRGKKSPEYKRSFRNLSTHLSRFEGKTGIQIYTDNFTDAVAEEFVYYLRSEGRINGVKKRGTGLMLTTVSNLTDKLRFMFSLAEKKGYKVCPDFENMKIKEEDANAVYLTVNELDRLNALTGLSKEAQAVRDRFLLGCYTALRHSDYSRLTRDNIVNNNIVIKTRKTGTDVVVPIHPVIRQILERNGGDFPKLPSSQAFNTCLKRICRKAGINDEILYERTIGLKVVRKRVKKYTLVSSHTARRTGATNMYLAEIPTFRIMLLTGHTTEQAFFKYIRIEREENARTLIEHPFFQ